MNKPRILWLKPRKGNISIDRVLIAKNLSKKFNIEIIDCSGFAALKTFIYGLREDFDLIIGTTHLGLILGGLLKLKSQKKFIVDYVDPISQLRESTPKYIFPLLYGLIFLEKLVLRIADAVLVVPKYNYKEISKIRSNVHKVNLCIDLDKFLNADKKIIEKARKVLKNAKVNLNNPMIVYTGGFSRIYNLDVLIEVMSYLPDFQLLMIGGGKLEGELKRIKEDMGLRNVFFLGYQPNQLIPGFLKHCVIGITLCEVPRQLKIYEYLAAGLRVIVPESVLTSEDFEFTKYCMGTKLDAKDVADSIRIALKMPKKKYRLMRLLDKYSCNKIAEVYGKIIRTLI